MTVQPDTFVGQRLKFGEFELAPVARTLRRHGEEIRLGSRALDILIALASRPGEVLSKDDLTKLVWRGAFVDDTALRVGISAVRKALGNGGDQCITTVPGRGYCFVRDVEVMPANSVVELGAVKPLRPQRLPAQITKIVGREEVITALAAETARRRLLSLVGPGGIGKTTVAVAVANRVRAAFDIVAFIDLAASSSAPEISAAAAAALGVKLSTDLEPVDAIAAAVGDRSVLVVLDNCEHVVDQAAAFVEALLSAVETASILATSRERLRAAGEWVYQLASLDVPPAALKLCAQEALRYSAVEMFEERASSALGGYKISDADAPHVAEICRRLDGMALAIELAAGRLNGLGVMGLAASVGDCFAILTRGRRTAVPRHQTLRATLDWSYRLLSSEDQAALVCLSCFSGIFTLEDAAFVMGPSINFKEANDRLTSLVDKSFVVAKAEEQKFGYRLLETTRVYGQEQLSEGDQGGVLRRKHAERVRIVFDRAKAEWDQRPTVDWLNAYAGELGNLRVALDWAFSDNGDGAMGAAITAAAAPIWFHMSLLDEGLSRVERAITWLKDQPILDRRLMMQLYAIAGWPQMRAIKSIPSGAAAWRAALAIAVELDDIDYQLRAIWALSVDRNNNAAATEAIALAERFTAVAERSADPQDRMIAQRIRGKSLHYLGDLAGSRREIEQMVANYTPPPQRSHVVRFQYDQLLTAEVTLVRCLWLQGFADQALAMVDKMIGRGRALEHVLTLAHVLSDAACFIALWAGDMQLAKQYIAMLRDATTLHALDVWRTYADAFEGELLIRQGMAPHGVILLQKAVRSLEASRFILYNSAFESVLAEGLIACIRHEEADEIASNAIARCRSSGAAWCVPELMRVSARSLSARGRLQEASQLVLQGLELARSQGALFWQLRLASTLVEIDGGDAARRVLSEVLNGMPEGFATLDYREAAAKLAL